METVQTLDLNVLKTVVFVSVRQWSKYHGCSMSFVATAHYSNLFFLWQFQ